MPILLAPLVGVVLGAVFAWVGAADLAVDTPIVASRPFAVVVAFAGLVFMPVVGYFAAFHGDWSYLYLISARRVPSAVDLGLVLAACAAVVAGFAAAARPLARRRFALRVALAAVPGAAVVITFALAAHRLAVSASYAQFHGDFGVEPIGASILGKGVLLMAAILAVAVAWTVRALAQMASESRG